MPKIAFIGAGSWGFTRKLVRDVLTFPLLTNSTITLMDIDPEKLDFAKRAVQRIVDMGQYPAKVEATMDRAEALKDADYVVVTILAGGLDVWRHDIETPKKYGVDINIGDTRGPSGIFRALRTIPVMLDIARDMEKYCPNATMLNYTNPMVMLCRAMQRETSIKLTGLCHSVQGTAEMLARWIGAPIRRTLTIFMASIPICRFIAARMRAFLRITFTRGLAMRGAMPTLLRPLSWTRITPTRCWPAAPASGAAPMSKRRSRPGAPSRLRSVGAIVAT